MNGNKIDEKIKSLMRVDYVGEKYAEVLIEVGINSPEELRSLEDGKRLREKINKTDKLDYNTSLDYVNNMIKAAKEGNYKNSIATDKYHNIRDRVFTDTLLLVYYENIYIKKYSDVDVSKEEIFNIEKETIERFKGDYKEMDRVRERNRKYKAWKEKNKDIIKVIKSLFLNHFEERLPYDYFSKEFYKEDNYNRKCEYCGITEKNIKLLIDEEKINTKRLYSRGNHMEVDRKESSGEYNKDNIALCCYWCNNAKTDEFTCEEFKDNVGSVFKKIWDERLTKCSY